MFVFSSKADVLTTLNSVVSSSIPPFMALSVKEWRTDSDQVLSNLVNFFEADTTLAVRSSCRREDSATSSGAGAFLSLLHILPKEEALRSAVEAVLDSYGELSIDDQVLIQSMVRDIVMSGVITTRVLADGSPYYVLNYDDESESTDSITGGKHAGKTVYVYRHATRSDFDSARLHRLVEFVRDIEQACGCSELDIEFCMDRSGVIHLLQVRPLCMQNSWIPNVDKNVAQHIDFVVEFVNEHMQPRPNIYGRRTILGVMPDWNPAEMIGLMPRTLASSLYREMITKRVWSLAREKMLYRTMPPDELMLLLAGRPYIDVRQSLNSLLPGALDAVTSEVLVNGWLNRLDTNPQLHDKIEFEVAQTCLDFTFDSTLDERYHDLLTSPRREAFRAALHSLTATALDVAAGGSSSLLYAKETVKELHSRQMCRHTDMFGPNDISSLSQLSYLAEECRNYGTIPFAILARHAFIAETLLRSAVDRGALSPERLAAFKMSVQTISGRMSHDFQKVCQGSKSRSAFLSAYGHLRPGSYDITSPRYADRVALFEADSLNEAISFEPASFAFSTAETRGLTQLLREAKLPESVDGFSYFAREAIAGREFAKFVFTRNISDILELLAVWGSRYGLDRETLSYLDFRDIMEWSCHALLHKPADHFERLAAQGRELFELGRSLKLSYLIRSSRDLYVVPQHRSAPNFIGSGLLEAPVIHIAENENYEQSLAGHIVCIETADPGFDWIFTRSIAGLITMFGGTNSHMAIRCAEYGLPAAIGVGERLFSNIASARKCLLHPAAQVLRAVA
ncbi:PEP-utilizing enzyme [Oleidesulfovibrio sp.]|uniref:PEP-utilizing enzyme n=1 Tax=Oleidesulfovibrio sp. TaxID=2909707 RepID=UPI003A894DFE